MTKRFITAVAALLAVALLGVAVPSGMAASSTKSPTPVTATASLTRKKFDHQNQHTRYTCCFASAAMITTNLAGKERDEYDIRSEFPGYGGFSGGADWKLMTAFAKPYGLYVDHYGMDSATDHQSKVYRREVREGLEQAELMVGFGAEAIVMAYGENKPTHKSSIFTKNGHCMVLYGFTKSKFKLSNPNPKTPQGKFTTHQLIRDGNIVAVWIYYPKGR